jgi:hypothetical protein
MDDHRFDPKAVELAAEAQDRVNANIVRYQRNNLQ